MPKPEVPLLENGGVRLRLLQESDLPLTLAWRNQDEIRRWFIHSGVIDPGQHRAWFDKYLLRENDVIFIIEEIVEFGRPVGQVALYDIDWTKKMAEFGRLMVDSKVQGKGIAAKATACVLQFGFENLGLEEIHLEVFRENMVAKRIYEKYGFKEIRIGESLIAMSVTQMEYAQKR